MTAFGAIVLAGGTSRRMALETDANKVDLEVGGTALLDLAIDAVSAADPIVVVGVPRPVGRAVVWTTEQPPGSGPAAAIMAGLAELDAELVVVVAADLPFAATAVPRLIAALETTDAAMIVDDTGRRQPLLAVYRTAALRGRSGEGSWVGHSVRDLVAPLSTVEVPAVADEALDCDTPADLDRARSRPSARTPPAR
jgi:molybdopterin-guanine dinucleotide biosynthesis protein A